MKLFYILLLIYFVILYNCITIFSYCYFPIIYSIHHNITTLKDYFIARQDHHHLSSVLNYFWLVQTLPVTYIFYRRGWESWTSGVVEVGWLPVRQAERKFESWTQEVIHAGLGAWGTNICAGRAQELVSYVNKHETFP